MRIIDIAYLELDETVLDDIRGKPVEVSVQESGISIYYIDASTQDLEKIEQKAVELRELFESQKAAITEETLCVKQ